MNEKRFIVQIGVEVDQHGHNNQCTKAAMKSIINEISNNCLTGIIEICNLKRPEELMRMKVHVKINKLFRVQYGM